MSVLLMLLIVFTLLPGRNFQASEISTEVSKISAYSMKCTWSPGSVEGPFTVSFRYEGQSDSEWQIVKAGIPLPKGQTTLSQYIHNLKPEATYDVKIEGKPPASPSVTRVKTRALPPDPGKLTHKLKYFPSQKKSSVETSWNPIKGDYDMVALRCCAEKEGRCYNRDYHAKRNKTSSVWDAEPEEVYECTLQLFQSGVLVKSSQVYVYPDKNSSLPDNDQTDDASCSRPKGNDALIRWDPDGSNKGEAAYACIYDSYTYVDVGSVVIAEDKPTGLSRCVQGQWDGWGCKRFNLAQGKEAWQSSTANASAKNILFGNSVMKNGEPDWVFDPDRFMRTNAEKDPWYVVHLGDKYLLLKVLLWGDEAISRYDKVQVGVVPLFQARNTPYAWFKYEKLCKRTDSTFPTFDCQSTYAIGRYLVIRKKTTFFNEDLFLYGMIVEGVHKVVQIKKWCKSCLNGAKCVYMHRDKACDCVDSEDKDCERNINKCLVQYVTKFYCQCQPGTTGYFCEKKRMLSRIHEITAYTMKCEWTPGRSEGPFTVSFQYEGQSEWHIYREEIPAPSNSSTVTQFIYGLRPNTIYNVKIEGKHAYFTSITKVKTRTLPSDPGQLSHRVWSSRQVETSWNRISGDYDTGEFRCCGQKSNKCYTIKRFYKGYNHLLWTTVPGEVYSCIILLYQHGVNVLATKEYRYPPYTRNKAPEVKGLVQKEETKSISNTANISITVGVVGIAVAAMLVALAVVKTRRTKQKPEDNMELVDRDKSSGVVNNENMTNASSSTSSSSSSSSSGSNIYSVIHSSTSNVDFQFV